MTRWHPVLAAHEYAPGEWILVDPSAKPYAIVRALEVGGERGYRAVTWAEHSEDRRLIGYWRSLKAACAAAHRAYLARHGPGDFAGYPTLGDDATVRP
jgi:hypothetical protein